MKCLKIRTFFGPYLDNELPVHQTQEVEQHLESCNECREEMEVMRKVEHLCKAGEPPAMADEYFNLFTARLHQRILSEGIKRERSFSLWSPLFNRFALAFSIVLLVAAGFFFYPKMADRQETADSAVVAPAVYYVSSDKDSRVRNYLTNSEIVLIKLVSMPEGTENLDMLKQTVSQSGLKEQIDSNMQVFRDNPEVLTHAKAMEIVFIKILNTRDANAREDIEMLKKQVEESGLLQKTQSMKI